MGLSQVYSPNDPGVLLASYNFTQDATPLGNMDIEKAIKIDSSKTIYSIVSTKPSWLIEFPPLSNSSPNLNS
jgi:hypothetical protein